jgi:hypothetical protein
VGFTKCYRLNIVAEHLYDATHSHSQGKSGAGGGASRESVLSDLAADISTRLPQAFDIEAARWVGGRGSAGCALLLELQQDTIPRPAAVCPPSGFSDPRAE